MAIWSYTDLIIDLVKHNKAQPLATRLALCFALVLGCISVGIGNGQPGDLVIAVVYACLSLVVVALTSRKDTTKITYIDKVCLGVSVIGATAFILSGESGIGIMFAIGADLVAYMPTIRESWHRPATQPCATYVIGLGAAGFAFAADFLYGGIGVGSAFTIYLIVIDGCLPAIIIYRRKECDVVGIAVRHVFPGSVRRKAGMDPQRVKETG